jgi:hypothetical protein
LRFSDRQVAGRGDKPGVPAGVLLGRTWSDPSEQEGAEGRRSRELTADQARALRQALEEGCRAAPRDGTDRAASPEKSRTNVRTPGWIKHSSRSNMRYKWGDCESSTGPSAGAQATLSISRRGPGGLKAVRFGPYPLSKRRRRFCFREFALLRLLGKRRSHSNRMGALPRVSDANYRVGFPSTTVLAPRWRAR